MYSKEVAERNMGRTYRRKNMVGGTQTASPLRIREFSATNTNLSHKYKRFLNES
jgi:hypothetical protein